MNQQPPQRCDLPFVRTAGFLGTMVVQIISRIPPTSSDSLVTIPPPVIGIQDEAQQWAAITNGGRTCYGQIQDAGPGEYHDTTYVFGADNQRPLNTRYHSAGMDVSPALNGCLGFADLNGENDHVDWRFVELQDVPDGPWRTVITTSHITP